MVETPIGSGSLPDEGGRHAFKERATIDAAEKRLACAVGVGHQAGHVAVWVADPRDVEKRTIGVCIVCDLALRGAILPEDLVVRLECGEGGGVGEVTSIAVRDGNAKGFISRYPGCEWRIVGESFQEDLFAAKLERTISHERAGEESRFAKDLEAVADAEYQAALGCKLLNGLHHRAEPGDGATPEVIPVAEAARDDHRVGHAE